MTIKTIIADDHGVVREGLIALLQQNQKVNVDVIAQATNGHDVVSLVEKYNPDLLIIDISMPDLNGIDAAKIVSANNSHTKVLALSMHKHLSYVLGMFEAGALGYVLKDSVFEDIIEAIETILQGNLYLSPKLNISVSDVLRQLREMQGNSHHRQSLTSRERQVLQLIAEGKETRQIANVLSRSVKTVESHRKNLMDKLDIHNVADLTRYAIKEGLISLHC